jgi:D-alanine-D-alanine ligase
MGSARKNVLALFGGESGEHAISVRSAATVLPALERAGHRVSRIGITRAGEWLVGDHREALGRAATEFVEIRPGDGRPVMLTRSASGKAQIVATDAPRDTIGEIDVVFPILHGPKGEDGTIQGLLEVIGIPFVGAGCAASAMAMDKLCMKTLCAGVGIAQTDFLAVDSSDSAELTQRVSRAFGFPCFVKPANLGSSVGISRVAEAEQLDAAVAEARRWDERVLVERAVDAREIEIALLGASSPRLSPLGEIAAGGFYDFATKYVADSAGLEVPAKVAPGAAEEIKEIASRVWRLIGCRGMARADFFVERSTGKILFNEINTIPGFTRISMYPRLWAAAGLDIDHLVDALVRLAVGDPD